MMNFTSNKKYTSMKTMIRILLCLMLAAGASQAAATENAGDKFQQHNRETQHHDKRHPVQQYKIISDNDFKLLCSLIGEASFDSDKITIIRAGSIGNFFSCRQAAKLLSFLSFDSSKLEALEYIAARIVGKKNIDILIEEFTFSSSKDKALKILSQREE